MTERKLGRGLDALIPKIPVAMPEVAGSSASEEILTVPPTSIRVNRDQPREVFDDEAIEGLARSIRQQGILQPLVVRSTSEGYELVAGERRLRAARLLELDRVPIRVCDISDRQLLEFALVENIQREDLNPLELARAFARLRDEHEWTQQQLAERLGKSRASIANSLRLLELPDEAKAALGQGTISVGHAKALLAVAGEPERLRGLLHAILEEKISVRETEVRAREASPPEASSPSAPTARSGPRHASKPAHILDQEQILARALGTKVEVKERRGRGKIVIDYYSVLEFERLRDAILAGTRGG